MHDSLHHIRQPLLDCARECHHASGSNKTVMERALHRASVVMDTAADRLWQAAAITGVDIAGDLVLADRLASAQQKWNADDRMGALDALLEAVGHMRRHIDMTANTEGEAACGCRC